MFDVEPLDLPNSYFESQLNLVVCRCESGKVAKANIHRHRLPPQSVSNSEDLQGKMTALAHGIQLESSSTGFKTAVRIRCVCVDRGVEMGTADALCTIDKYLPSWARGAPRRLGADDPDEGIHDVQPNLDVPAEQTHALPNALLGPGFCHATHNMEADLDNNLKHFSDFRKKFKQVIRMCQRTDLKEEFLESCLKPSRHGMLKSQFTSTCPNVPFWRWGQMNHALNYMKQRRKALTTFDKSKFMKGRTAAHDEELGGDFDKNLVHQATHSEYFWACTDFLLKLHEVPAGLRAWAESCPCHWFLQAKRVDVGGDESSEGYKDWMIAQEYLDHLRGAAPDDLKQFDGLAFTCPMAGKRALEVAKGEVKQLLGFLLSQCEFEVIRDTPGLSDTEFDAIMSDFQRAKSYLDLQLNIRFGHWLVLPWALVLLSDPDEQMGRRAGARLMEQFDASIQVKELHHRLTWLVFSQGSVLRHQMEQFISGTALIELPELRSRVRELFFCPLAERIQEGDHSRVSRYIATRVASGQTVSLTVRQPEIEAIMRDDRWRKFSIECYYNLRTAKLISKEFGLHRHPLWFKATQLEQAEKKQTNWDQLVSLFLLCPGPGVAILERY